MGSDWRLRIDRTSSPVAPPPHPTFDLLALLQLALDEDAGGYGDLTSLATVPPTTPATATFLAKADGIIAGLAVAELVFRLVDQALSVTWSVKDGDHVSRGTEFGSVRGSAIAILTAERIALNLMQRMSGIATATAAMVAAVEGSKARILETRKTAPGHRVLDKWAVLIGGGVNHRIGLYDMIMIKDNHIAAAGGIAAAVDRAQAYLREQQLQLPIEVETTSLHEVQQVLDLREADPESMVTRIMLDNMALRDPAAQGGIDVRLLREAVQMIAGRCETEASGNVTLATVAAVAATGVDFVSCGALTHSVAALDVSLNIVI